tara:strand:- start:122 stop:298 length:177 start_codon:yes stop_codon:yes gene_type:complete
MSRKQTNKNKYSYNGDRDIFGTPRNRSTTWSGVSRPSTKRDRRTSKNNIKKKLDEFGL